MKEPILLTQAKRKIKKDSEIPECEEDKTFYGCNGDNWIKMSDPDEILEEN
jgi:hypothetical protein